MDILLKVLMMLINIALVSLPALSLTWWLRAEFLTSTMSKNTDIFFL